MGRGAPQEMFYKGGQRGSWGWPPLFMGTINNDSEEKKNSEIRPFIQTLMGLGVKVDPNA